ncbi:ATP-binding cassette domain-containing protein [Nonomuraea sp. CA-143628]|uniref:ATP-binding cassette domain-containing protein n=1 Tax=Nonomuraea sp. CA-143628 TaxID=3239997 RepID=UPI003D930641
MVFTRSNLAMAALGPVAGLALVALMQSGAIPAYQAYSVGLAAVYAIVVLSVGLLAGWSGVWSVGHPAFVAVGAYFAAYGGAHQWPLEWVIVGAIGSCALMGAFLGYAGARFSVLYIALLTLAFSLVSLEVINRWTSVTGGDQGVAVAPLDSVFGAVPSGGGEAQYLAVLVAGVVFAVAIFARSTALRMRLVAAKAHPLVARSVGIVPEAQTALSFAVSAAFTGLAGVLLGLITGFVSPDTFSLNFGVTIIAACVLGGVGTVFGAVVGGVYLVWVPTVADAVSVPQPVVQGVLLIAALIFLPGGVVPFLGTLVRRALGRRAPGPLDGEHHVSATAADSGESAPATPAADDVAPLLVVDGLSVRFGGLNALESASLDVRPGEVLAIIGPNGAGKTTLLNAVSGLIGGARISGAVGYAGVNLMGTRATARRGLGIARTFQHAETFSELTVAENVLCTKRWVGTADRARADELLALTGLADVADRYPAELPFGLQKRLDLARAIAEEPKLLILDEPFGGLDATERQLAAQQIVRLRARGAAVVIIDHVLDDLFAVADRVVAFDFGKPIGSGEPGAILADPKVRSSYLGLTATRAELPDRPDETVAIALRDVSHHYGGVAALHDVHLDIGKGSVIGVVGANGAGKSTLGKIIHGSLRPSSGQVRIGESGAPPVRGSLVPEGRALFKTLSLRENLEVAGYAAGVHGSALRTRLDETAAWLPERLRGRLSVAAAGLSGGEQQILAIARALMARPDVLILDEPALGLAPALVDEVYARINQLAREGMTIVLLEQLLSRALTSCHEVVVLHEGRVAACGDASDPSFAETAELAYFGGEAATLLKLSELKLSDVNELEA